MTITTTELPTLTGTWALDPAPHPPRLLRQARDGRHRPRRVRCLRGHPRPRRREPGQQHRARSPSRPRASTAATPSATRHVRSADFLDVETYPTLAFVSSEVRIDGDDFVLVGDLTVQGRHPPGRDRRRDRGHRQPTRWATPASASPARPRSAARTSASPGTSPSRPAASWSATRSRSPSTSAPSSRPDVAPNPAPFGRTPPDAAARKAPRPGDGPRPSASTVRPSRSGAGEPGAQAVLAVHDLCDRRRTPRACAPATGRPGRS